ncbi:MAG: SMC-Scp complex subunit ScpB [Fibrobacter sp.]|jgi:segregation and condensation protein B|nr:SMC-Scp complex subunit ScpB [Fibrobacter sp.]
MKTVENDGFVEVESQLDDQQEQASTGDFTADSLRILEALLFASDELLSAARIKAILPDNPDARKIRKMVDKINVQLQKERHPFEIVEIGGGYQFRTVAYYHPWVRQIFKEKAAKKLSIQALECLAIIAYKQPVSKAEIEAIRGVVSDGAMKTLLEKKLVTISGRSDKPGKPLQYSTTHEFLKYFGLNKIEDLPRIEEFEAIAREKIDDLSFEELSGAEGNEADVDTENQDIETEQQEMVSEDSQISESTETEGQADSELLEKQNLSGEDQLGQDNTKETSETISGSETPAQAEQIQVAPEPTAVFEIHDFLNEDDSEEEAKAKEPSDEKVTVAPEPTAVFEIHDFVDELESEASAEENSDQTGNSLSDNCSSESSSTGKKMNSGYDLDMIEIETAEIAVDNKEQSVQKNEITDSKNSADSGEKKAGSVENSDEDAETLEIFLPGKSVSNVENEDSTQQKKGFFSKIRKKKNEESEE